MATNRERLRARFDEMRANGLINFNIFPGDGWNNYDPEQRAGFILEMLDAPRTEVRCVTSKKSPVNLRDLVERLP